jgi:hypothetical protein
MGIRWQVGAVVAPAMGGIMISTLGVKSAYILDVITYIFSLALIFRMKPVPPSDKATPASLSSLIDGVKYAVGRKDLLGTYIVDFAAMFFAMPNALFPFWADHIHARWALGLFYCRGNCRSHYRHSHQWLDEELPIPRSSRDICSPGLRRSPLRSRRAQIISGSYSLFGRRWRLRSDFSDDARKYLEPIDRR